MPARTEAHENAAHASLLQHEAMEHVLGRKGIDDRISHGGLLVIRRKMGARGGTDKSTPVYCAILRHRAAMSPTPRSPLRRIARLLGLVVVAWLALSCAIVMVLRFVPPWTSATMMERRLEALTSGEKDFTLRHRWVPWDRISPQVGIAMVAAEDQKFPFHHGFDVDAIQDAIDAADEGKRLRGASTISQQVARTCSSGTVAASCARAWKRTSPC